MSRTRPVAIELAFDGVSDRRLGGVWSRLSALYDRQPAWELGVRPHVTLALFRAAGPEDPTSVARSAARALRPFRLDLATVDRFPGAEGVVFLRPRPSPDLDAAHALVHDLLGKDRSLVDAYYRPDAWQPHCTMGIHVPEPRMEAVRSSCEGATGSVEVTRLQLVRYAPVSELWVGDLIGE